MAKKIIIRTESDAEVWLREQGLFEGLNIVERKGVRCVVTPNPCGRCGGSGRGPWFPDGGICYGCRGADTRERTITRSLKKYAQLEKSAYVRREKKAEEARLRAEAAHERMLEGQRNWCEAHGFGRITFEERDALREQERQAKAATKTYVGTIGKREVFTATVKALPTWDSQWGTTICHIMEDADGNTLVWKSGSTFRVQREGEEAGVRRAVDVGDTVTFKATVKEHSARRGECQTIVTRAALVELVSSADQEAA